MAAVPHKSLLSLISPDGGERLKFVLEMMREVSRQTDPQALVEAYGARMQRIIPYDGFISLSRRDLAFPYYRITRSSRWEEDINPWKQRDALPMFDRGFLGELIYGEEPVVVDDFEPSKDDPAYDYLTGFKSMVAIPMFDQGRSLNMVIIQHRDPGRFSRETLPEHLWVNNLFGRMTHNLVLSGELRDAYHAVDREMQIVADIQRSLLPVELPTIPTLELSAHYQTSRRAGGDYYDFFKLPDGKWGILIADVSGHGTPAAVIMAVTHSIAHTLNDEPDPPSRLMNFINHHLTARYTNGNGTFVTAFYGIYDPQTRTLKYANAGHNPPRHRKGDTVVSLQGGHNLPLGIDADELYTDCSVTFSAGDAVIFYTDGITEARGPRNELLGVEPLDTILLQSKNTSEDLLQGVLKQVEDFTGGAAPTDDRTVLVARMV